MEEPMNEIAGTRLAERDAVPVLTPAMVVEKFTLRRPHLKTLPDGERMMIGSVFVYSTRLWVASVTRDHEDRYRYRSQVWLRKDDGVEQVYDEGGFHTTRGAQWAAYRVLNRITTALRTERLSTVERSSR